MQELHELSKISHTSRYCIIGLWISEQLGFFYVGFSETRKHYLRLMPGAKQIPNMIQVYSIKKRKPIGEILLPNIEQVNNTYLISQEIARALINLWSIKRLDFSRIDFFKLCTLLLKFLLYSTEKCYIIYFPFWAIQREIIAPRHSFKTF